MFPKLPLCSVLNLEFTVPSLQTQAVLTHPVAALLLQEFVASLLLGSITENGSDANRGIDLETARKYTLQGWEIRQGY